MTLAQDVLSLTSPGHVYTPMMIADQLEGVRSSSVKKTLDNLIDYGYFVHIGMRRYLGREINVYLRLRSRETPYPILLSPAPSGGA